MANTYNLISSSVLGSAVASVTFSSIPNTYTDLILRCSARRVDSGVSDLVVTANSFVGGFNNTNLQGNGSSVITNGSILTSGFLVWQAVPGSSETSNTFGNIEMHISNYLRSSKKSVYSFGVGENAATTSSISTVGSLWSQTTAISSLVITTGNNFAIGSSFYLYGIKNT